MKMRSIFVCSLMVLLLVSGVAMAQQRGGGGGRPPGGPNGQGQPPAPPVGGDRPAGPPPPPNGNNVGQPPAPQGGGAGRGGAIAFPTNYNSTFSLYAVVDRPDNVSRLLYIRPESLAAMQTGQPLPDGTKLVIEAYQSTVGADGTLVRGDLIPFIHVSEKINGRWRFASFSPAGVASDRTISDENPRTCAGCHDDIRGFVFSRPQLNAFAETQTVQYFYCGEAGREPCN